MNRRARCQCGALSVATESEPASVVICSCSACQRRSGSPFGEGAYFQRDQLTIQGEPREYVRTGDSGKTFHTFFCATCGTSLYWFSERDPDRVGVAVGAFFDANFPAPDRSVYDRTKHKWIQLGADIPGFEAGRDSQRSR